MRNTLTLIKEFCEFDFVERNCEKALALLTDDICWFGTSDNEDVNSIKEAEAYLKSEMKAMPSPYRIKFIDEKYMPIGESSGEALLRAIIENNGISISLRITGTSKKVGGEEKICTMHFSVADHYQEEDEYFPMKKKMMMARNELVMSTMAGGMMGGYMKPGFPFYFVSERMLTYLGYENEEEFVKDIKGYIENVMHPEDRDYVDKVAMAEIAEKGSYTVDYRMKKKDGSYIWVHDIGQAAIDENDEDVIISVCYDITSDYEKQAQLDNIINALPGGVALYKLVDDDLELLYQSKGVSQLSGRTEKEYAEVLKCGARASIYHEDRRKVFDAIYKTAKTGEAVSLDYRILHKNGNYGWITGNFKRSGIENETPIIHAVFTEMSEQNQLFRQLTEDSGNGIIVTDKKNHELLYMNKCISDLLKANHKNYQGKKCYEHLFGRTEPCDFCKQDQMKLNEEKTNETYLEKLDKHLMAQGRIVQWAGREAHIECLADITETKKAQHKVNEMVQNIACGLCVIKTGGNCPLEVQYINEGLCKIFELTKEEFVKRAKGDIFYGIHEDDLPQVIKANERLRAGAKESEATFRYVTPKGGIKWVTDKMKVVLEEDSTITIYGTYFDVTEQMELEEELQKFINTVPGGNCLYRWNGEKLEPKIISKEFSDMIGDDAEVRMGTTKGVEYVNVHPDDLPELQKTVMEMVQSNKKTACTYRSLNSKTKEYIWLYAQGVAVPQDDGSSFVYISYTDITKERELAQNLKASESALDAATEQVGLWYWKYEPATNRVYPGPKCRRDFGFAEVEENYTDIFLESYFVMPQYKAVYIDALEKMEKGQAKVMFDAQVKFKNGEVHWVEYCFTNVLDKKGVSEFVICTARLNDVAKAIQSKYELEKQKPSLGEQNLLVHALFDLEKNKTIEYGYTDQVQAAPEEYDTMQQAIDSIAEDIVGEKEKKRFLAINNPVYLKEQFRKGNMTFSVDYRRRMRDGRLIWVKNILHLANNPDTMELQLFEYCYDINMSKMGEEVLTFSTTYDYERIATVNFDTEKTVLYGEQSDLKSSVIRDYYEMRNKYADTKVLPEEREMFVKNTNPKFVMERARENEIHEFSAKIIREDGTRGVVKTRFVPYDVENKIYVMTRTDVTNILREEEIKNNRLREALTLAQQASTAKTDFLSSMSHDIRTPMNAIVGMCELAIEDEGDARQVHESLQTIQTSSQLLLSLINNILDMSRIESGKMKLNDRPFLLTEQVKETAESYRVLAEQKQQKFELYLNVTHSNCMGDVARVHSAIDNILANAIKYTPNRGTIIYRVSEIEPVSSDIGRYRFEISDTGYGMDEESQKHIFEAFYRGKSQATEKIEGTGLGLSITKAIVDLKGGTISVKSSEGVGTTFVVELPIHFADKEEVISIEKKKQEDKKTNFDLTGINVLLCEDNAINQKVAKKILEKVGASVVVAEDGKEGYEKFVSSDPNFFDLILMDIQMPNMNGYDAAKAIRKSNHARGKTVPIIAMTANAFSEDVQKCMTAGMNEHLAKPIVPAKLYNTILNHVNNKGQSNSRRLKVLFVDDTEINIAVLTAAISNEYEVFVARDGEEALRTLEQTPDIAAVITDIMMPNLDGVTLIKTIRASEKYNRIAIIANTQYGDAQQEKELLEIGADDFLYKPTTPALVRRRLKSALQKYQNRKIN